MSAFKGTPGPWDWDGQILVRRIQAGEGPSAEHPHLAGEWDEVILGVLDDLEIASDFVAGGGREYCDWSVSETNARLIAAAPELLEALMQMVERISYYAELKEEGIPNIEDWAYTYNSGDMQRARAAIQKATGGDA